MITQLRSKAQITIPKDVVKALNLKAGDHIDIGVENGSIVLKPVLVVPKDQAWFFTEEWQRDENKAQADVKRGRMTKALDADESRAHLNSLKNKQQ